MEGKGVAFASIYAQILTIEYVMIRTMSAFVEINKPRSSAFLVDTWYRPPNSPPERFNGFENVIDKIDAENRELCILGDINCNLLPEASTHNSSDLTNIFDSYGLSQ